MPLEILSWTLHFGDHFFWHPAFYIAYKANNSSVLYSFDLSVDGKISHGVVLSCIRLIEHWAIRLIGEMIGPLEGSSIIWRIGHLAIRQSRPSIIWRISNSTIGRMNYYAGSSFNLSVDRRFGHQVDLSSIRWVGHTAIRIICDMFRLLDGLSIRRISQLAIRQNKQSVNQ